MRRGGLVSAVFYGGLLVLMCLILARVLDDVLPGGVGRSVAFDSEAYVVVLLLAPWIQYVRPRLAGTAWQWPIAAAAAAACVVVGVLLYRSDLPSQFRTLNEAFLAGIMIAYVQPRRPVPRWIPVVIAAGLLAVIVVASDTRLVTDLAEGLGVVILLPLAVDVFDRRILEPAAPRSPALTYAWYAFLVLAPIIFSVLNRAVDSGNALDSAARYGVRPQEAFVAVPLLGLYFAVLRSARDRESSRS